MFTFETTFPDYPRLQSLLQPYQAYLVGGAVRDAVLNLPVHDLDFSLPDQTLETARRAADALGGDYFTLDEAREAGRVILTDPEGTRHRIDFTTFQGPDIESDLQSRDFTITAMALPVADTGELIDPLGGMADIQAGIIRTVSEQSLREDPVRTLRGVRMAVDYRFKIEKRTQELIRGAAGDLQKVSGERLRDELFRILECGHPAAAVRVLNTLGISRELFPTGQEIPAHKLAVINRLEEFWDVLAEDYHPESAASWASGLLVRQLGRYRHELQAHLQREIVWERSLKSLLTFNVLAWEGQSAGSRERALEASGVHFRLSAGEIQRLRDVRRGVRRFLRSGQMDRPPSDLEIHRFFRICGGAGVEAVFLALAESFSTPASPGMEDRWDRQLLRARAYLQAWWEEHDRVISPPRLIDGHQLMDALDVNPGPEIGNILRAVQEAQAAGQVNSREQALDLASRLLEDAR